MVVEATVKVTVEEPEPGAAIEVGLKPTVTPVGAPDDVSAITELNPPETAVVIFEVPLLPAVTVTAVGDAEIVKAGVAAAVTVSETEVVSVRPSPLPVMVIG